MLGLFLAACTPGCRPPGVTTDTGTTAVPADTGDSPSGDTDSAPSDTCNPYGETAAYDRCTKREGTAISYRVLVRGTLVDAGADVPWSAFAVARDASSLATLWNSTGLSAAGEPLPVVDFATEQVVALGEYASCDDCQRLGGFFADAGAASGILGAVRVQEACSHCDTSTRPEMWVWATPIGDVARCDFGYTCVACE